MEILPHQLIRAGGLPVDSLHINKKNSTINKNIERYLNLNKGLELLKKVIIDKLFVLISDSRNSTLRKEILNIKRNFFNDRSVEKNSYYTRIDCLLNYHLSDYYRTRKIQKELFEEIKSEYEIVIEDERMNLKGLFDKNELRSGLLFSSIDMLNSLKNYNLGKTRTKKFYQVERGMLKYATRVCTKTSPFSTFTTIGICKFDESSELPNLTAKQIECSIKHKLRLNSFILKHLTICFKINKIFRKSLFVHINSSAKKEKGFYYYLITKNNIDVLQRLNYNEVISLIYDKLIKNNSLTYGDILNIIKIEIKESKRDIDDYLLELLENGFLEIGIGISEVDLLWEIKLIDFLKANKVFGLTFVSKISELVKYKEQYEQISIVEKRKSILEASYKIYTEIIDNLISISDFKILLDKKSGLFIFLRENRDGKKIAEYVLKKIRLENLFYEDVRKDLALRIPPQKIKDNIKIVNDFIKEMAIFKYVNTESFSLYNYFKTTYCDKEVSLIELYEGYFGSKRNINVAKETTDIISNTNDYEYTLLSQYQKLVTNKKKWEKGFKSVLRNKVANKDVFDLSISELKTINKGLDLSEINFDSHSSFSSLFHFYYERRANSKNRLMFVLNTVGHGYGRLFARFMDLFDEGVLNDIRDSNSKLIKEEEIFMENSDSSAYNLNIHPPILDRELSVPGGTNNFDKSLQINISSLSVRLNEKEQKLELFEKQTNKRVFVFDISLQDLNSRSSLYNFLTLFSKGEIIHNQFYLPHINKYIESTLKNGASFIGKIKVLPRVVIEECIIVQRKKWILDKNCIPKQIFCTRDKIELFILYNDWRKEIDLPDEVFIMISSKSTQEIKSESKPQYINFNSPLLINYFHNLLLKMNEYIVIEEMLPNTNDLVEISERKSVSELLIQWNSYGES